MTRQLVRRVDHFYAPLQEAERGFEFLTRELGLPLAWPFTTYGVFASGGVFLGNVNIELLRAMDAFPEHFPHGGALTPARVRGIAFEPEPIDDDYLEELDRRGIVHTPAMPQVIPGMAMPMWTNVGFAGLIDSSAGAFACQYHSFDVETRRAQLNEELMTSGGGAIGLVGVEELVIGASDPQAAEGRWQNLFDPASPAEPGLWRLGDGPAIRIVSSDEDRVEHIVVRVRSLDSVHEALDELDISTERRGERLFFAPEPLNGLTVVLV